VQPGECELGLRVHAERTDDPCVAGSRDCVLEQSALADAGLTAHDQRPTPTCPRIVQQAINPRTFTLTAEEHALSVHQGHG